MAECPKCPFTGLKEIDSEKGFGIDECPECGGRWYDLGELEKLKHSNISIQNLRIENVNFRSKIKVLSG